MAIKSTAILVTPLLVLALLLYPHGRVTNSWGITVRLVPGVWEEMLQYERHNHLLTLVVPLLGSIGLHFGEFGGD